MGRVCRLLAYIAVFAVAVVPFIPTAHFGLINLDDYAYAENEEIVTSGVTANAVSKAFTDVSQHIWMPLTWLSYALDYEVSHRFLPDPPIESRDCTQPLPVHKFMHVHSVALHGLNAVLLLALLAYIFRGRVHFGVCVLAALFWAVHPLRCESVCWIASRKDLLSMAFLLAALAFWCRFVSPTRSGLGRRSLAYIASFACLCLGAMAKPSVMTFPVLAFLLDVFFMRRDEVVGVVRQRSVAVWGRLIAKMTAYVPPLLVAVVVGLTAKAFQDFGDSIMPGRDPSAAWRLLNALNSVGVYIWHTVFPTGLAVQCVGRYPGLPRLWPVAIPVALAVLGCVAMRLRAWWTFLCGDARAKVGGKIDRVVMPGLLWYLAAIAPMLGIAGFGYHAFADRFTYIPAVGFSLALCGLFSGVSGAPRPSSGGIRKWAAAFASVAVIGLLAAAGYRQSSFWRDDGTLFTHTLDVDGGDNYAAHFNLGFYEWEFTHNLAKCVKHYEIAYKLNPEYVIHSGIAAYIMALCESGRDREASQILPYFAEVETATLGGRRSSGYYATRGLSFLCSDMEKAARNDLAVLERDTPNSTAKHFLAIKMAEHDGDLDAVAKHKESLRRANARHNPDYARYRYLCK